MAPKKKSKSNQKGRKNNNNNNNKAQPKNPPAPMMTPVPEPEPGAELLVKDPLTFKDGNNEKSLEPMELKSIHPEDDWKALEEYLVNQTKYDYTGLSAVMPHTTQQLMGQVVSPHTVTTELLRLRDHGIETAGKYEPEIVGNISTVYESLACELAALALPDRFMNFGSRSQKQASNNLRVELYQKLQEQFATELFQAFADSKNAHSGDDDETFVKRIQRVLEQHCIQSAKRLDQMLFQSKTGTFLRLCPVYQKDGLDKTIETQINDVSNRLFETTLQLRKTHLSDLCMGIAIGVHLPNDKICWECRREIGSEGITCDKGCSVATYCSLQCQGQAWVTGHDKACCSLQPKQQFLEESLSFIESMHNSSKDIFSASMDFLAVRNALDGFSNEQFLEKDAEGQPVFSMKYYYHSLMKVLTKQWWIFEEPIVDRRGQDNVDIHVKLATAVQALCMNSFPKHDYQYRMDGSSPAAFSADEFIEFYSNQTRMFSVENEKTRAAFTRFETSNLAMALRVDHHKIPTEPEMVDADDDNNNNNNNNNDNDNGGEYLVDGLDTLQISEKDEATLNDIDE